MTQQQAKANDNGAGPGSPTDALSAIASAIVAAKPTTPDTADPNVALAFALGWQMGELSLPPAPNDEDQQATAELQGLGTLGQPRRIEILVAQVTAGVARLHDPLAKARLDDIAALADLRERCLDEATRPGAVEQLHDELLSKLTAADFRLGKAYELGVALSNLCRVPATPDEIAGALREARVGSILRWLDDLATALPPHAGHSVAASLETWREWADPSDDRQAQRPGRRWQRQVAADPALRAAGMSLRWRRQGELWRALLSGEKQGSEMLEIEDWLAAAHDFEGRIRRAALRVVTQMPIVVGLVVVLFGGGLALMIDQQSRGWIVAGAASVLSALGLTWKGIGGSIGKLAAKLEQPLFGAATDTAIADAVTLLRADGTADAASGRVRRTHLAHRLRMRGAALSRASVDRHSG